MMPDQERRMRVYRSWGFDAPKMLDAMLEHGIGFPIIFSRGSGRCEFTDADDAFNNLPLFSQLLNIDRVCNGMRELTDDEITKLIEQGAKRGG
jgi:hypothetical protein